MFNKRLIAAVVFVLVAVLGAVLTPFSTVQTASAAGGSIVVGGKTISFSRQFGATDADVKTVRNIVLDLADSSPNFYLYASQSTAPTIEVEVYRNINTVDGGEAEYYTAPVTTGVNYVRVDLTDNERVAKHLEVFTQAQRNTIATSANKWVLAHEFGHLNGTPRNQADQELRENAVLADIGAGWQRVDYGKPGCPTMSNMRVGTANGALNVTNWFAASGNNWSGWSGVAEDSCSSVGGIAEPQVIDGSSQAEPADEADSNDRDAGLGWLIAALAGAAVAAIAGFGALRLRTRK